jgi:hypothetical protein
VITKKAALGIVSLAVIAIALSLSPSNLLFEARSATTHGQSPVQSDPPADPVLTSLAVVPAEVVANLSQTFTVEVWIYNVTDMAGWQIKLTWNRNIIKCVDAQINTPPEWGGVPFDWFNKTEADPSKIDPNAVNAAWLFAQGVDNEYTDTLGQYFKAECFGPNGGSYHNTFNGSIAVVTLTFQALRTGSTLLGLDVENIIIGNSNANRIAYTFQNALAKVQAP